MSSPPSRLAFVLVPLALLAPCAAAGVLKVGGPGQTHATIQAAVDAAVHGDVVLVRATSPIPTFTIDGKGIAVVADQVQPVPIYGGFEIRNVPAGRTASASGFTTTVTYQPGAYIHSCAGAVRVQDVTASAGAYVGSMSEGAYVSGCANVAFERCSFGATRATDLELGPAAFYLRLSTVAFHDCVGTGGQGGNGGYVTGSPRAGEQGGPGILVDLATVFVSGSTFVGGPGGTGLDGPSSPPCATPYYYATVGGRGGDGIEAYGAASQVRVLDTITTGGPGGQGGFACGTQVGNQGPGQGIFTYGAAVILLPDVARSISVPRPAREQTSLAFQVQGAPLDRAYLAVSPGTAHVFNAALNGVLLGAAPYRRIFLGTLDANGSLQASLPVGDLGPGVTNVLRHAQCVLVDTNGASRAGGSAELVLLDAAY